MYVHASLNTHTYSECMNISFSIFHPASNHYGLFCSALFFFPIVLHSSDADGPTSFVPFMPFLSHWQFKKKIIYFND